MTTNCWQHVHPLIYRCNSAFHVRARSIKIKIMWMVVSAWPYLYCVCCPLELCSEKNRKFILSQMPPKVYPSTFHLYVIVLQTFEIQGITLICFLVFGLFLLFFLPTYSMAGRKLTFWPKCLQKSFVDRPWPKLAKFAYLGGQNACFRDQKCKNLQNNYFAPNPAKSLPHHLGQNVSFLPATL